MGCKFFAWSKLYSAWNSFSAALEYSPCQLVVLEAEGIYLTELDVDQKELEYEEVFWDTLQAKFFSHASSRTSLELQFEACE